jgi:hypothetical protein
MFAPMPLVTEAMRRQYQMEGFMILTGVIPTDMLAMLREECSYFLGFYDSQMDARSKRYFIINRYRFSARSRQGRM